MEALLKDVIHLYLGCECLFTGERHYIKHSDPIYHKLVGIEMHGLTMSINGVNNIYPYGVHKPVLRELSEITEKEQAQWDKVSTPIGEMAIESAQQIHWAKRLNFLRSAGIDCDGLLESGQAINKLTINK